MNNGGTFIPNVIDGKGICTVAAAHALLQQLPLSPTETENFSKDPASLAASLGVTPGAPAPAADTAFKLAHTLGCSPATMFFSGTDLRTVTTKVRGSWLLVAPTNNVTRPYRSVETAGGGIFSFVGAIVMTSLNHCVALLQTAAGLEVIDGLSRQKAPSARGVC
jgi:hypothetical protein